MNYRFTTFWYISKHVFTVKYYQILSRELLLLSMYLSTINNVHCVSDSVSSVIAPLLLFSVIDSQSSDVK